MARPSALLGHPVGVLLQVERPPLIAGHVAFANKAGGTILIGVEIGSSSIELVCMLKSLQTRL